MASFTRNVNKYNDFNSKTYDFGSGFKLYPSEIHTMVAIAKYQGMNISELGKRIGITKSAASQVIKKLEKKGMIHKGFGPENQKSILITLTDDGREVVSHFESSQDEVFQLLMDSFLQLDDEKIEFARELFAMIEKNLDYKLEKYK